MRVTSASFRDYGPSAISIASAAPVCRFPQLSIDTFIDRHRSRCTRSEFRTMPATTFPDRVTVTPRDLRFANDGAQSNVRLGGDPAGTAVLNALSLTFPDGERLSMDGAPLSWGGRLVSFRLPSLESRQPRLAGSLARGLRRRGGPTPDGPAKGSRSGVGPERSVYESVEGAPNPYRKPTAGV